MTSEADVEKEATDSEKPVDSDPPPAPAKVVYSDSESSDEEDERELQGRTYSDKGVEVSKRIMTCVEYAVSGMGNGNVEVGLVYFDSAKK